MISIVKATGKDAKILSEIAIPSFIESHGHSAPQQDISNYVNEHYNPAALREELETATNIFHFIYYNDQPVGYSKIILDKPYDESDPENITKLERIYVLQDYHDKKIGMELFQFNREFARSKGQAGLWLFVWVENHRAIRFYEKNGFRIAGHYDFRISATHTNPNHRMLLLF